MKKGNLNLDGQLSLWDVEIKNYMEEVSNEQIITQKIEKTEQKQERKAQNYENSELSELLKKYPTAERIIRTYDKRLIVKYQEETVHFSSLGEIDFKTKAFPPIMHNSEILYSKNDEEINEIQKNQLIKLKSEIKIDKLIKRFGDKNYIAIANKKVIIINKYGWILEVTGEVKYKNNEVIPEKKNVEVGDLVEVEFKGKKYIGEACRIYGPNNCTVNVIFNNKHTAFFRENIRVIS